MLESSMRKDRQRSKHSNRSANKGWDPLAAWYDGMVGEKGSKYHQELAIPAVLKLLQLKQGDRVIDIGCGQGVLAGYLVKNKVGYVGVDVSSKLIDSAKQRNIKAAEFHVKDATKVHGLNLEPFDEAVFMLSIQDIPNMKAAFESMAKVMKQKSRVVVLMLHPAFRIPRQSGWGYDENRKLQYRRVDSYLSEMNVPLKPFPGRQQGVSISYHRPMQSYINELGKHGFNTAEIMEIAAGKLANTKEKAALRAADEIPMFLGIRAERD